MKRTELNNIFSTIVTDYIKNDYVIATESMSGHQGEICKVFLKKDEELIGVVMDRDRVKNGDKPFDYDEVIQIKIGRYTEKLSKCGYDTVWLSRFNYFETRNFYPLCDLYERDLDRQWFVTKEEYDKVRELKAQRLNRYFDTRSKREQRTVVRTPDSIKNHVRTIWGYKRTKDDEIEVRRVSNDTAIYGVWAKGKFLFNVL